MPWPPYPRQAADGAFALEACQVTRATSVFDDCCLAEPLSIRTTLFPCSRLWSTSILSDHACNRGRRVRASTCVRILSF